MLQKVDVLLMEVCVRARTDSRSILTDWDGEGLATQRSRRIVEYADGLERSKQIATHWILSRHSETIGRVHQKSTTMNTSSKSLTSASKFLSLILRHQPEVIGMQLDPEGWLPIDALIQNANRHGQPITLELLHEVVASCEKKRFSLSDDGLRIRANQGHSVAMVELNLEPATPPNQLYHGTVSAFMESIRDFGLLKRSRNHVHLSADIETANKVGARRGKPVILIIHSESMHASGHTFYLSKNGVWLTDHVPTRFIEFPP